MITHHNTVLSQSNRGVYAPKYCDSSYTHALKVYVLKPSRPGSWWKYNLTLCLSFWHIVCKHIRERMQRCKVHCMCGCAIRVNIVLTKNRYMVIESWLIQKHHLKFPIVIWSTLTPNTMFTCHPSQPLSWKHSKHLLKMHRDHQP